MSCPHVCNGQAVAAKDKDPAAPVPNERTLRRGGRICVTFAFFVGKWGDVEEEGIYCLPRSRVQHPNQACLSCSFFLELPRSGLSFEKEDASGHNCMRRLERTVPCRAVPRGSRREGFLFPSSSARTYLPISYRRLNLPYLSILLWHQIRIIRDGGGQGGAYTAS
jgi:hypothetical protein